MHRKPRGYLYKLYVSVSLFIAIIVLVLASIYVYSYSRSSIVEGLVSRANSTAAILKISDKVMGLSHTEEDVSKKDYLDLKSVITDLRSINNDVRFVYILTEKPGEEPVFVVDSEDPTSADYSPPGQVYDEASPALKNMFVEGKTIIEGPIKDRWGNWVSAIAPVKDSSGNVLYVVGMDISAKDYIYTPILEGLLPIIVAIPLMFVIAIISYFRKKEISIIDLKSQFVSIASHELRSPLTGIRWSTETLLKDPTINDSTKSILGQIRSSCLGLIEVVNQLLDITVIESGIKRIEDDEMCNLKDVINETLATYTLPAKEKSIRIDVGDFGDLQIKANKYRLKTLFDNIISNSIKYSKENSFIQIVHKEYNGKMVIDVVDEGIGIPSKDISHITKGFFRADNAKASKIQGTGLGLYLCIKIVEDFGGKMSVRSEEGVGTLVSIELPFIGQK